MSLNKSLITGQLLKACFKAKKLKDQRESNKRLNNQRKKESQLMSIVKTVMNLKLSMKLCKES